MRLEILQKRHVAKKMAGLPFSANDDDMAVTLKIEGGVANFDAGVDRNRARGGLGDLHRLFQRVGIGLGGIVTSPLKVIFLRGTVAADSIALRRASIAVVSIPK